MVGNREGVNHGNITGQDGSYLAELLLSRGYEVHGIIRRASTFNTSRIDHLYADPHDEGVKLRLHYGDLSDGEQISNIVYNIGPDEIYHLGAQSHVNVSFEIPEYTANVTALGVLRVLQSVRGKGGKMKFYQASSSEMFGTSPPPQNEETPFRPRSPYAISKVFGYEMVKHYREAYHLFSSNGILFNHESPRRGETFVTRKITRAIAGILTSRQKLLYLGNLDAKRDWGYAPEYCISDDTEVLTINGFRTRDTINVGDVVVNFNIDTKQIERDVVLRKQETWFEGEAIHLIGKGVDILAVPEHRIVYQHKSKTSKGGWSDWKIGTVAELAAHLTTKRNGFDYRLPPLVGYAPDITRSDEEMLWATLIGYLVTEGHIKDTLKFGKGIEVSLSQSERKNPSYYDEVIRIINELGLTCRKEIKAFETTQFTFNADSSRRVIERFDGFDVHRLPEWVLGSSRPVLENVFRTMMNGDGHWGSMTYVSKRVHLAKDFQTVATMLGYRTRLHEWASGIYSCIVVSGRSPYAYATVATRVPYEGLMWCVTTNNTTIIIRRAGAISVVGNCEAMWKMLQLEEPIDLVVGTGESHAVREFVERAFSYAGLDHTEHVKIDSRYFRPTETGELVADASKAKKTLGWSPKIRFEELVKIMVDSDLRRAGLQPPGEGE